MADQVLSRTLNQKFDTVFEEVTHQETLNLLNRNDLKLFCLDIETNQFNYDPLVEFLEDNLGMYVFSRAELDELVDAGKDRTVALKAVRRLIKTGNPGEKGTGSELGEILDYCFFEHVLEAPKILSKYEQVTAGGTYKAQSEGVHLLSVGKAGAPAYQLVYGASGIIDDIQDAIDKAFEEIAAVSNGQRKERQVVDSTVMGRSFDEDTTARLKEILLVGALKKALNDYTANKNGRNAIDPTVNKEELIQQIIRAAADAKQLLAEHDFDLDALIKAENFKKMALLKDGAEAMCSDPETKKSFDTYANEISRLVKYLDRNDITQDVREQTDAICAIFREMQKKRKHIDTTDLMVEINHIINENVEIEHQEGEGLVESRRFDISQIDFDLLAAEFAKVKRKNLMIKDLNDLVQERLSKMMAVNPSRVDYYVRYMGIIETYNAEQDRTTIEKTFMELMDLAKSMSEEEQRYAREGFSSDEELSIYDLLFSENLSKSDIDKIKKMSKDLLKKIKERIAGMDHWTDKQETRAAVDVLIRNVLYEEIPDSMFDRLEAYRKAIYEHIYTHYKQAA